MASILPSAVDCCVTALCSSPVTVAVPGPPGPPGPPGDDAEGGIPGYFIVEDLADARALPSDPTNLKMDMLGSSSPGDSFGGIFFWDNNSIEVDNYNAFGGSVITPNGSSGAGRWIKWI